MISAMITPEYLTIVEYGIIVLGQNFNGRTTLHVNFFNQHSKYSKLDKFARKEIGKNS